MLAQTFCLQSGRQRYVFGYSEAFPTPHLFPSFSLPACQRSVILIQIPFVDEVSLLKVKSLLFRQTFLNRESPLMNANIFLFALIRVIRGCPCLVAACPRCRGRIE
jgi:hypothetical protein